MICDHSKLMHPVPGSLEECIHQTSIITKEQRNDIAAHLRDCETCREAAEGRRSSRTEDRVRLFLVAVTTWWLSELRGRFVRSGEMRQAGELAGSE